MGKSDGARTAYTAGAVGLTLVVIASVVAGSAVAGPVSLLVVAGFGATLSCWGAARMQRSRRHIWWAIAVAQLFFFAGDLLWTVYGDVLGRDPYPVSDIAYLAQYPALALGIGWLIRGRRRGRDRAALLDAAILTTGVGVVGILFVFAPAAAAADASVGSQIVAGAYPVGDLLLLSLVVRLFTAQVARYFALWALFGGLAIFLVCDTAYSVTVAYGLAYPDWIDIAYLLVYLLIGLAAIHPSAVALSEPAPEHQERVTGRRLIVLAAALMLVPLAAQVAHLSGAEHGWWVLVVGGCLSAVLVIARLADLLHNAERSAVQLAALAGKDSLTGISNRRAWDHELSRACAIAREDDTPLVVAALDLDHFKQFNDSHGHLTGDLVLKETAAVWSDLLQGAGILARIGGDEFAVLLPDMVAVQAVTVLDPTRRAVGHSQTCSIGVATWDGRESPAELLARADRALYLAKRSGRNRIAVDDGLAPSVVNGAEPGDLVSSLRSVYQPIVKLRSGEVVGHEALSRFEGVQAQEAFERAARNGSSALLEAAAVSVALTGWDRDGLLALNVSPAAIVSPHFREVLPADLTGIIIELTEQALGTNPVAVLMAVDDLRDRGALIAIDDFGAGFSNLARIVTVRPDIVKLDISIVQGVHLDATRQAVVAAAVHFSQLTDGRVFAEGIELPEERDCLVRLGVLFGQGFLLGAEAPLAAR